jgi:ABC transporter DrrB family efflux protein
MSAVTLPRRIGPIETIRETLIIMRRNLLQIKADPEQLVGVTIQPLMFLVLFVYVFGGAIGGSTREYLQFALPGIIIQGVAFTPFATALGMNIDFQRGLIDRFRSLPISRSAVVAGRISADGVRVLWGVLIMIGFGTALGFRFHGGFAGAIGSIVLATAFGMALCWPMAFIGISAKTPEAVNTWGFMIILPLTFVSSAFVNPASMPGWLEAFANVNPITKVIDAMRGLMLDGQYPLAKPLWQSIVWIAAIVLVFAPLTIAKYRRRV